VSTLAVDHVDEIFEILPLAARKRSTSIYNTILGRHIHPGAIPDIFPTAQVCPGELNAIRHKHLKNPVRFTTSCQLATLARGRFAFKTTLPLVAVLS
jgi:hypothetical protein